jgi:hypothetical protein
MKINSVLILLISLAFFSCEKEVQVSVKNNSDTARQDEVVIVTMEFLSKKVDIQEGWLPIFKKEGDELVFSQIDDLDGDGKWDEAAVLLDIKAGETKVMNVEFVLKSDYPIFEKRTNLRLGIHQKDGSYKEVDSYAAPSCKDGFEIISQAEGVNWENDKIGFRVYFDCRNVKDLFGKRMPTMVVDKVHTPGFGSYHDLADWGMDVLHCGSSLGSGGIALMKNDSLYRLGSTDVYEYHKIVEGPVRSIFELRYKGWEVDGEMLEAVERISIYPGKYWFESDVTVKGCSEGSQIVTGIVTSHLKREPFKMSASDFQVIGTHGVQSLNKDELGMAIAVPQKETGKIGRTTNINFFKLGFETVPQKKFSNIISETYYIGQKCKSDISAKHYFFSVWGLDKDQWKTEDGFKKYIEEETVKLSSALEVL